MFTKVQYFVAVLAVLAAAGFSPITPTVCHARDTADRCDNSPPPPPPPPPVVAAVRG